MSSPRTSEPTLAATATATATLAVLAIGLAASVLVAIWLYACADTATIGVSTEHGALKCPDCTEGVAESE